MIVQSVALGPTSTVVIAPTSASAGGASYRPQVEVAGRRTRVLAEQVAAVDRSRVGRHIGRLEARDLEAVDDALRLVLGLL